MDDRELFVDEFHKWLEKNGVTIGKFDDNDKTFDCKVDLNKLKLGILILME